MVLAAVLVGEALVVVADQGQEFVESLAPGVHLAQVSQTQTGMVVGLQQVSVEVGLAPGAECQGQLQHVPQAG